MLSWGQLVEGVLVQRANRFLAIVEREDAGSLSPNDEMDPRFGLTLREAVAAGVEAYAFRCKVDLSGIALDCRVSLNL